MTAFRCTTSDQTRWRRCRVRSSARDGLEGRCRARSSAAIAARVRSSPARRARRAGRMSGKRGVRSSRAGDVGGHGPLLAIASRCNIVPGVAAEWGHEQRIRSHRRRRGSGGLACAQRAARHGARALVIESGAIGGTCVTSAACRESHVVRGAHRRTPCRFARVRLVPPRWRRSGAGAGVGQTVCNRSAFYRAAPRRLRAQSLNSGRSCCARGRGSSRRRVLADGRARGPPIVIATAGGPPCPRSPAPNSVSIPTDFPPCRAAGPWRLSGAATSPPSSPVFCGARLARDAPPAPREAPAAFRPMLGEALMNIMRDYG